MLVTDVGQAIICDFGLSQLKLDISIRSRNEPAAQHAIAGTMCWQSPERLAGGRLTWQCDVYAFAIAVYEVNSHCPIRVLMPRIGVYWTSSLWLR